MSILAHGYRWQDVLSSLIPRLTTYYLDICPLSHPIWDTRRMFRIHKNNKSRPPPNLRKRSAFNVSYSHLLCWLLAAMEATMDRYRSISTCYCSTQRPKGQMQNCAATVGQKQSHPDQRTALTVGCPRTFGDRRLAVGFTPQTGFESAQRLAVHPRRDCVEDAFANQLTSKRVWPPLTSREAASGATAGWAEPAKVKIYTTINRISEYVS